ncbi:PfaD family polyunsaturated fatty acid/polyketide biosynthesis protein [Allokutzneria sp. A3M-2-11 16]|uniref:PfaD family polyunsaturated fatty acid/polyketide biosynthesis protein n=1 Tax=Allokutzneria sp. A3M-2-11 16 TaxID=2962043 RepID=UPI0020B8D2EA|nr:PfaD family polyunsaturated fatty acid/polyketide biosynthesis protein [Allokutzneria sp. A3M-2-11 16]MCP3804493.1 PfaD family polyunsaturated fatty acid/polyketide biosynthesis protein [Allokutzneria sp. A3M-2-11 16]
MIDLIHRVREPLPVTRGADGGITVGQGETLGVLPALYPEWLGDRSFCEAHGVRFPYVAGEMANGIATTRMVVAMARADMLGFFGAGGLAPSTVESAVEELSRELAGRTNWGVNLIHSPTEPAIEEAVADLLLRRGVPRISASAFMTLTPAVVRCAVSGLRREANGWISRRTTVFAKLSRPELAEKFLSPAPEPLLRVLVERGQITAEEAELARHVPVAEDVTVEADSGGHTDNRPLSALLPTILAVRDEMCARYGYHRPVRVGAAGGLGTPAAVAAAFALGAAYVLTGSVNQVAVEAGVSEEAKKLLAQADITDVAMAPAADMFELGVKLQVLKRGTMFAARANRLYQVYRDHDGIEGIPQPLLDRLEKEVLGASVGDVWVRTKQFWAERDPAELDKAERDPKHRMALVFRWYLGGSSRWAITGDPVRRSDYQLWCGPAMGAFNRWAAGSFLAEPANRSVVQIALNLLEGAAVLTRAHQARTYGVAVPAEAFAFRPRPLS